jgi:hypothetical protein
MLVAIADTHAAIWFSSQILAWAKPLPRHRLYDCQRRPNRRFGVTIAEMIYLTEKGRIPPNALNDLHAATALFLGVPVLSRDRICSTAIQTIR